MRKRPSINTATVPVVSKEPTALFWMKSNFGHATPVYWLNGLAGTGKSTIARTTAERIFTDGRLGASFFCSRDFEDHSNLRLIFPTLAVQLTRKNAEFRSMFVPLVLLDPQVVNESLYGQMSKLIVQPPVKSGISTVIVIDALDECKDHEPASGILSILSQFLTDIPKVKFFVTGRPEPCIRDGLRLPLLAKATDVLVLHDIGPNRVDSDVRLFFKHNFSGLKERRPGLDDWPTEGQLDWRAAGFFTYAIATLRFINQKNQNPKEQLACLLQSLGGGFLGRTKLRGDDATLDSLYRTILEEAFGDNCPKDGRDIRPILGSVVLVTNPLSPSPSLHSWV